MNYHLLTTLAVLTVIAVLWVFLTTWRFYRPRDLETARRKWTAISPSGNVVLGLRIDYEEALKRASRLGTIAFTDLEGGYIFYNVVEGTSQMPGGL